MHRLPRLFFALLSAYALSACTGLPDGVEAVDSVDPERYLGTWYEIARLDHSFERDLRNVTATYSKREDGGINVLNKGYNYEDREWNSAEGKAYPIEAGKWNRLKVSFFGPFYGGYNIVALDEDYQWVMVVGPSRDYLWILARSPDLERDIVNTLVSRAEALEFDVSELIFPDHSEISG
ncbi:MAG: lipocalin family protein [Pseudomonadota bacterium]